MVPLAAAIAVTVAATVPTSRDPNVAPIDWYGLGLSSAGMGLLVFGIIQAPNWGWGSAATFATLAGGLAVLGAFVDVERRLERPMLDVRLFRNPRFTAASGSITIGFFTLAGFTFLITQYFQFVKGYTPLGTGVRLLPVATSIAIAAVLGTKLAVRIGNKSVVAAGLAMFGAGLLWISTVSRSTSYLEIVGQMLLAGGGLGLITAPATEAIMGAVPTEKAGIGSAVNDATRLFGAALGVAVLGSVAASLYHAHLGSTLPAGLPAQATSAAKNSVGGALIAAQHLDQAGLTAQAHALSLGAIGAFLHSLAGSLRVAGAIAIGGSAMAVALLPSRPTAIEDDEAVVDSQPALKPAPVTNHKINPIAERSPSEPPHRHGESLDPTLARAPTALGDGALSSSLQMSSRWWWRVDLYAGQSAAPLPGETRALRPPPGREQAVGVGNFRAV